jgi:hypothetical protein
MSIDNDDALEVWDGVERRSGNDRRKGERRLVKTEGNGPERRQGDRRMGPRRKTDRKAGGAAGT